MIKPGSLVYYRDFITGLPIKNDVGLVIRSRLSKHTDNEHLIKWQKDSKGLPCGSWYREVLLSEIIKENVREG